MRQLKLLLIILSLIILIPIMIIGINSFIGEIVLAAIITFASLFGLTFLIAFYAWLTFKLGTNLTTK